METGHIILFGAAFATSVLSAIVGMAGGLMLLAVMTATLPAPKVVPLHGVVQLFSNTTRFLVFVRHIRWPILFAYLALMVPGVAIATMVWSGAVLSLLKPVLGAFILLVLVQQRTQPLWRNPPLWLYAVLGGAAGFLSLFVGAIGPMLAPFFLRDDFDNEEVIATKAACQASAHLAKLPAFLILGYDYLADLRLLAALAFAVVAGTFVGKYILGRISTRIFRIIYRAALILLATYLIALGVHSLVVGSL